MNLTRSVSAMAFAAASLLAAGSSLQAAEETTVIELTQTACQFIETEGGVDHRFKTTQKADCEAINDETGEARLAGAVPLELKPGKYIFRVTNRDVPYPLGFWLRGDGLVARATLPSISGGGMTTGKTLDYEIVLEEGEYVFSCPLNPTPDYPIVVKG